MAEVVETVDFNRPPLKLKTAVPPAAQAGDGRSVASCRR